MSEILVLSVYLQSKTRRRSINPLLSKDESTSADRDGIFCSCTSEPWHLTNIDLTKLLQPSSTKARKFISWLWWLNNVILQFPNCVVLSDSVALIRLHRFLSSEHRFMFSCSSVFSWSGCWIFSWIRHLGHFLHGQHLFAVKQFITFFRRCKHSLWSTVVWVSQCVLVY